MKIICVARNYAAHATEMGAKRDGQDSVSKSCPYFFLKPDSALLQRGMPFFYPEFSNDVEYEAEIVVRIDKVGKSIEERFAYRYYHSVAFGIDMTARDLQSEAKAEGMPWTMAKGFDGSAVVSDFVDLAELNRPVGDLHFTLARNGAVVQQGHTAEMLCPVDRLISHVSRYMLLRTGDLLFTGTPAGVGAIAIGDVLTGTLEGREILTCKIK